MHFASIFNLPILGVILANRPTLRAVELRHLPVDSRLPGTLFQPLKAEFKQPFLLHYGILSVGRD
jgi:hypothetical protein